MNTNDLQHRKLEAARRLYQFKLDRYRRWWNGEPGPIYREHARNAAAAKYGIDPRDI